jgi:hypothetical protein
MKIEIDEREIDTLPNDAELGRYVRHKLKTLKEFEQNSTIRVPSPHWVSSSTLPDDVEFGFDWESNLGI